MKMINAKSEFKRFFVFSSIFLVCIFIVLMIQNVVRYGMHDTYDPFIAINYFAVSLLIFLLIIPIFYKLEKYLFAKLRRWFWAISIPTIIVTIGVFYLLSNAGLTLTGYFDYFPDIIYARRYFGREFLFHLMILGYAIYIIRTKEFKNKILISGSLGRKEITIQSTLVRWIEADDHYLKIHTADNALVKRTTLEQMAEQLKPDFIRIHRKFLVNKHQIVGKERQQRDEFVILQSGERLKIGRSYQPLKL